MSQSHWKIQQPISSEKLPPDYHPLLSQLLYNRGIADPSQFDLFLAADKRLQGDPFLMPDMPQAVHRVYQALLSGEKIAIYGDFDADGITGTAVLVQGLSRLGGTVVPYIPHRLQEGYGLRLPALQKLQKEGVSLVITTDCGVTAFNEIKEARRVGLDVIVTDHHLPTTALPPAVAIVNPKLDHSAYPYPELAGVGVAFKLLEALLWRTGREDSLNDLMDLVALGTVTDMAPLVTENRYLVRGGLKVLNEAHRPGISEMIRCAKLQSGSIDSEAISWALGPRLNTAGRIDNAIIGYQLLMTKDAEEAQRLATDIETKNTQRQQITSDVFRDAKEELIRTGTDHPLLFAKSRNYPPGVIGIVAGRLSEQFVRPVVMIRLDDEICRGSARTVPGFDLISAFRQCDDLLRNYGGHSKAAGFALLPENLLAFEKRLVELAAQQLAGADLRPCLLIDAEISLSTLGVNAFELIQQMEPFGTGNPEPTFLSRHLRATDVRAVGNHKDHISLTLKQEGISWPAIGFGLVNLMPQQGSYIDAVYNLKMNRWNGEETLRLNLLDLAPSLKN